jgi:hypothetical protein
MKIRQGFVTNSSSTSFIISMKEDFTVDNFLKALGMEKNSILAPLVKDMFELINMNKRDLDLSLFVQDGSNEILDEEMLFTGIGGHDVYDISQIIQLFKRGWKVYHGFFDSDSSPMESFLCSYGMLINTDDIYFNFEHCDY